MNAVVEAAAEVEIGIGSEVGVGSEVRSEPVPRMRNISAATLKSAPADL